MGCGASQSRGEASVSEEKASPRTCIGQEEKKKEEEREEDGLVAKEKEEDGLVTEEREDDLVTEERDLHGWSPMESNSLRLHNHLRAKHASPPLKLNRDLCTMAQLWADDLARLREFKHSSKPRTYQSTNVGENLYSFSSTAKIGSDRMDTLGEAASESWYNEIELYDYDKAAFMKGTGHFTQLVWDDTRELGVAFASYADGPWTRVVIVANYLPAGNVRTQFEKNVKPLLAEPLPEGDSAGDRAD